MGCNQSSQVQRNGNSRDMVRFFKERPNRIQSERMKGKFMRQMVREIFDKHPSEVYDFCGPELGTGGYGSVMTVQHRESGANYAMKTIDITDFSDFSLHLLRNEIECMKYLVHPNIIRLQEVYQPTEFKSVYLIMDKLEGGTIRQKWRELDGLPENYTAFIISGVISAVRYCHDRNVAHRDLKMDNILFETRDDDSIVKVIDFGISEKFGDGISEAHELLGTRLFAAPEVLKLTGHGLPCDMWSIGIIVYALICNVFPFYDADPDVLSSEIKYCSYGYPPHVKQTISPLARDFIDRCLVKKPKKRLTAAEAQSHPWLKMAASWINDTKFNDKTSNITLSILDFQYNSIFKKVAMEIIAYMLDSNETHELTQEFMKMDVDGDGVISLPEFKAILMKNLGKCKRIRSVDNSVHSFRDDDVTQNAETSILEMNNITEEEAENIFNSLDIDKSGSINFTEFIAGCLGHKHMTETTIRSAFDRLDYDRKGGICLKDLQMYVGSDVSEQKLETALQEVDSDGDGLISYEDFRAAMMTSMYGRNIEKAMSLRSTSSHGGSMKSFSALNLNELERSRREDSNSNVSTRQNPITLSRAFSQASLKSFSIIALKTEENLV